MEMEQSSNTSDYYEYEYDYEDAIELDVTGIVVNSVILYFGLCANIWMLWALCKTWKSNSRLNCFLLPLCITDILILCARCGMTIGMGVTYSWKGGYYTCICVMMFVTFCSCLAHFILAFLNVDNVITIACNKSSKILRIVLIVVALLTSVAVSIPEALIRETMSVGFQRRRFDVCLYRTDWPEFVNVYGIVREITHTWIPIAIALLFGVIALCLWCATKGKRQYKAIEDGEQGELKTIGRVVALTLVLDIFLLVCWAPDQILMRMSNQLLQVTKTTLRLFKAFRYLTVANSLINPFIYVVYYCVNKKRQRVSPGL